MTTELKKQKLQEYLETATPDEIEIMYADYLDETGPVKLSEEFAAEMEDRVREIESGEVKTISMEEVFADIKKTVQKTREHAAISG